MNWDEALTDLLALLVRSYPDPASARAAAEQAGLPTRFTPLGGPLDDAWMAALRGPRKTPAGLQAIARAAQRDYPNIDSATLVRQIDERALKGPKLEEPDWKGPPAVDEGLEKVIGEQPTFLPISFLAVGLE